jgi:NADH-quinone oxidoreductase subunit I
MYCGICVEECPYDALEWAGELTQPEPSSESLIEEMVITPHST